jgi:ABC-type transport system substrate-binding protein
VEVQTIEAFSEYENRLKTTHLTYFGMGGEFHRRNFRSYGDYHGAYNYGKFSNSEMNDLLARATTSIDPAEHQALHIQAERIFCETEAALIPIYHNTYNIP